MKFAKPRMNESFLIASDPEWPNINFETDATGAHIWQWTIAWGPFTKAGKASTPDNKWNAKGAITNYGGTLTVRAEAKGAVATIVVKIQGANPGAIAVMQYLAQKSNSMGFDKIIEHESKFIHFGATKEPVKSFDNGYGICQLTNPRPTFEQIWNWKLNIDGGLSLFDEKRISAINFLSQSKRTYTSDQLKYEAVSRWNGGSYHEWDEKTGNWRRKENIICDPKTGNIGWDMNDEQNKGKTVEELHKRDSGSYSKRPGTAAKWMYSGVCYADSILD